LAELAADVRASTPSNAAELLVPDRKVMLESLKAFRKLIPQLAIDRLQDCRHGLAQTQNKMLQLCEQVIVGSAEQLELKKQVLAAFNPQTVLQRGYAIVRSQSRISTASNLKVGDTVLLDFADGRASANITSLKSI
jgi:exodeoxyribonuclease VII large subunit